MREVTWFPNATGSADQTVRQVCVYLREWGVQLDPATRERVATVVANLFCAAARSPHTRFSVGLRLVLNRRELAVEALAGAVAFPRHRSADRPLPEPLSACTTSGGIEERANGCRFWATVDLRRQRTHAGPVGRCLALRRRGKTRSGFA
ncbi:hypothetical protein ACIOGZ_28520 [Kitasatospora sp. NPDC088160]|uniref:hypothetical protein n=1 Tax=Kitasatospora sp. NPDC088160 TaxID=3364072 RepID=UPI00383015AA